MTTYYFEGDIAGGRTETVMTQDRRYGDLNLVQFVATDADPTPEKPTTREFTRAFKMTRPPLNQKLYLLFDRSFVESTARIGETISFVGEPQRLLIIAPANRYFTDAVQWQNLDLGRWWKTEAPDQPRLRLGEEIDERYQAGMLTLTDYQAEWRALTNRDGQKRRAVSSRFIAQRRRWYALYRDMWAEPKNEVAQLVVPNVGEDIVVTQRIPGDDFLQVDPALYLEPYRLMSAFGDWLRLGQQ